ncbi:S41 family peptidase [Kiloniella sp.]|uniref:S41 family peptidase n=1 Tax=Kiloniella sp. TaxID=1938587 RepID=UPI003B01346A
MLSLKKVLLTTAFAIALPTSLVAEAPVDPRRDTYRQLELFGDVFERIKASYVEEVSDEELIESAIHGMLTRLDPHSSYLTPDSFKDMRVQTRGEFGGLGIEVTMENGFVKVVSPIDDTPASKAGIEAGDFITHLDGEAVLGLTLQEAVERMRGKVGSELKITISREGVDSFDVTLERAVIKVRSVRHRIEDNIGYVRVSSFNEQTTPGLEKSIKAIQDELGDKMIGLVLDLRLNPGGLLTEAISVSDAFLEQGEIVSTRGRDNTNAQRFNARSGDLIDGKPLVVLINGGSASASEIVAGALQDHRRAIIMGTQSFGKGSVQTIMPLRGNGAMRLTTSRYYTPSGRSIQSEGIAPDITVEQAKIETLEANNQRREADLRGALENKGGTNGDSTNGDGEKAAEAAKPLDYQLDRALDLIQGISLYNTSNGASN